MAVKADCAGTSKLASSARALPGAATAAINNAARAASAPLIRPLTICGCVALIIAPDMDRGASDIEPRRPRLPHPTQQIPGRQALAAQMDGVGLDAGPQVHAESHGLG